MNITVTNHSFEHQNLPTIVLNNKSYQPLFEQQKLPTIVLDTNSYQPSFRTATVTNHCCEHQKLPTIVSNIKSYRPLFRAPTVTHHSLGHQKLPTIVFEHLTLPTNTMPSLRRTTTSLPPTFPIRVRAQSELMPRHRRVVRSTPPYFYYASGNACPRQGKEHPPSAWLT